MTHLHIQQCTRFSKINHAYYFVEAVRSKDYKNLCRHFLWQLNRQNNQPFTQKSIVSSIARLTEYGGIDIATIANALTGLKNSGEIERFKGVHNRVGWNPDVTNQIKWTHFNSKYAGYPLVYSQDESLCMSRLLNLSNANSYIPRDFQDLSNSSVIEENNMLKYELGTATREIHELKIAQAKTLELLQKLAARYDDSEAKEVVRHLKLVPDSDSNSK
jgi:hypothetical protein